LFNVFFLACQARQRRGALPGPAAGDIKKQHRGQQPLGDLQASNVLIGTPNWDAPTQKQNTFHLFQKITEAPKFFT